MKEKAKLEEEKKDEEKEDPKGIPEFWSTVFKNVDLLSDMLQVRTFVQTVQNETQCLLSLLPPVVVLSIAPASVESVSIECLFLAERQIQHQRHAGVHVSVCALFSVL